MIGPITHAISRAARMIPVPLALAYLATIPLANLMIQHVGWCAPAGPCLLPVWPGLWAPSGVYLVGLALVLRDGVQEEFGSLVTLSLIAGGTALSALIAPPALVLASAAAFALSEGLDFLVYTPLKDRHWPLAVALSGLAGAICDSAVFLWLAFGSLEFLAAQVLGKVLFSALAALLLAYHIRPRRGGGF